MAASHQKNLKAQKQSLKLLQSALNLYLLKYQGCQPSIRHKHQLRQMQAQPTVISMVNNSPTRPID